jgi:hypothetical protein
MTVFQVLRFYGKRKDERMIKNNEEVGICKEPLRRIPALRIRLV